MDAVEDISTQIGQTFDLPAVADLARQRFARAGLSEWANAKMAPLLKPVLAEEAGVEPTTSRLATLPGFEVRTPHRGRFSS